MLKKDILVDWVKNNNGVLKVSDAISMDISANYGKHIKISSITQVMYHGIWLFFLQKNLCANTYNKMI